MSIDYTSQPFEFPESRQVDVQALSRIFDNATNSYKFLFFLSLLAALERGNFTCSTFSLPELVLDMLVYAWYPHVYFKLSFGAQDKVTRELDKTSVGSLQQEEKFRPWEKHKLRSHLRAGGEAGKELRRYVPYRLIRVFFPNLKKEPDHRVNALVAESARVYFATARPLYKFSESEEHIELHPAWLEYLANNLPVVKGWACWSYLQYMQKANPMVPSLTLKLFPPAERESLTKQTEYWRKLIARSEVRCIYSGERLNEKDFCLDHFLPWSFVVHNELWNLVPASNKANASKSDRLPAIKYVSPLINLQYQSLRDCASSLPSKQWELVAREYAGALKLETPQALLEHQTFERAYEEAIRAQLALARINGFEDGWSFG